MKIAVQQKVVAVASAFASLIGFAGAQSVPPILQLRADRIKSQPNVIVPPSTQEGLFSIGKSAHTNHLVYTGPDYLTREATAFNFEGLSHGPALPSTTTPSGFHPNQLQTAYGIGNSTGSSVIAIVDAYHYPTALADFNVFAKTFGLPQETSTSATLSTNKVFQVAYATGTQPPVNASWAQEEALDIEWSHAMASGAKIVLVEAASSSYSDLMTAVTYASKISGVTQISMSWGGTEWSGETSNDAAFAAIKTATLYASSGDVGGAHNYPAMSPYVVAVGGTTLYLSSTNSWSNETGWSDSGGGVSSYELEPAYQKSAFTKAQTYRSGPDIAAVANPSSGVAVYDSTASGGVSGWLVFGGTSVASPLSAAVANAGGAKRGSAELTYIYSHSTGFHDITVGTAGSNKCAVGWDAVTGWGSVKASSSL